jgi:hypothetical protein
MTSAYSRTHDLRPEEFRRVTEVTYLGAALIELAKPFTKAEVRYFNASQLDAAWRWLETTP